MLIYIVIIDVSIERENETLISLNAFEEKERNEARSSSEFISYNCFDVIAC